MPALAQQSSTAGAAAMQSINRVILNPIFLAVFLGAALCASVTLILTFTRPGRSWWTVSGAVLCVVGMFVVTVVFNVPLNNRLDATDVNTVIGQDFWRQYLAQWTIWNHLRSVTGLVGTALLTVGLMRR